MAAIAANVKRIVYLLCAPKLAQGVV